jgi:hypothetical protein
MPRHSGDTVGCTYTPRGHPSAAGCVRESAPVGGLLLTGQRLTSSEHPRRSRRCRATTRHRAAGRPPTQHPDQSRSELFNLAAWNRRPGISPMRIPATTPVRTTNISIHGRPITSGTVTARTVAVTAPSAMPPRAPRVTKRASRRARSLSSCLILDPYRGSVGPPCGDGISDKGEGEAAPLPVRRAAAAFETARAYSPRTHPRPPAGTFALRRTEQVCAPRTSSDVRPRWPHERRGRPRRCAPAQPHAAETRAALAG